VELEANRGNLDRPPMQPDGATESPLGVLTQRPQEAEPGTRADMQITGAAIQTAVVVQKGLVQLAKILPGFGPTAQQMIMILSDGVNQSLKSVQGEEQSAGPIGPPTGGIA